MGYFYAQNTTLNREVLLSNFKKYAHLIMILPLLVADGVSRLSKETYIVSTLQCDGTRVRSSWSTHFVTNTVSGALAKGSCPLSPA